MTLTVDQANDPPVAVNDSAGTAEDTAVTFSVTGNDNDPDGSIDPASVVITGGPANGSLVVNGDGTVTYTPDADFSGSDSFTYTVQDNEGLVSNEATVNLTVDPANDPPVAVADSASTDVNTAVDIDILGNDSDADGNLVPGSVAIMTQPSNGSVTVDPVTGQVTYTPDAGYSGTDSFTYTVQDDDGNTSNTATVSLVVNDGDVTVNLPAEAGEGTASVDEAGLDGIGSDAASDSETTTGTFSYSAVDTPVDIVIGGVTVVENGALTATTTVTTSIGVLTVTGFNAAAGELDYSYTLSGPITDGAGVETDSIEVSVSDDDGDSATGFININIIDDVPTIQPNGEFSSDLLIDEATIGTSAATDKANFAAAFINNYGADGQGAADSRVFSLAIGNSASGLVDTVTGNTVVLSLDDGDVVGKVAGSGEEVFRVAVDTSGDVTLTQSRAVQHPFTDQADEVIKVDAGTVSLIQRISDGDGDTAEASIDLGATLSFQDDAPPPPSALAPVTIDLTGGDVSMADVSAEWLNPVDELGDPVMAVDNVSAGDDFIQLQWGEPTGTTAPSGYDFELSGTSLQVGQATVLGTFTHNNFPIFASDTTLDETDLVVSFNLAVDGDTQPIDVIISIDHTETPNNTSSPEDIVQVTGFTANIAGTSSTSTTFQVGFREFTFNLDGFVTGGSGGASTSLTVETAEGQATDLDLQVSLTAVEITPFAEGSIAVPDFGADGPQDGVGLVWDGGTTDGSGNVTVTGTDGTLTVDDQGNWRYDLTTDRDDLTADRQEVFTFSITDEDGDSVERDLVINLDVANTPIALDLDGDGVEYLSREASVVFTDQATGEAVNTAWVAGDDGLLVIDADDSGTINESREYVFTEWSETAETDMEAVAEVFDSNQNQVLDAADEAWSQFAVWRDANSDGITDAGELVSLDDLGVESIALSYHDDSEATEAADGDVKIFGQSEVTWEDGEVTIAEDTSFAINVADLLPEADGAEDITAYLQASFDGANTIVQVSKSGGFTGEAGATAAVDRTVTFEGIDLVGGLEGSDAIQAMIDAGKLNVDQ